MKSFVEEKMETVQHRFQPRLREIPGKDCRQEYGLGDCLTSQIHRKSANVTIEEARSRQTIDESKSANLNIPIDRKNDWRMNTADHFNESNIEKNTSITAKTHGRNDKTPLIFAAEVMTDEINVEPWPRKSNHHPKTSKIPPNSPPPAVQLTERSTHPMSSRSCILSFASVDLYS